MRIRTSVTVIFGLILLSACATPQPTGPSVMALAGTGKSFDQFRADDADCRNYATAQIGGPNAGEKATNNGLESAAVGTVVGAAAGALLGGHQGAGVGAGAGLLVGSAAGAGSTDRTAYGLQRSYDNAYTQCMYAKGEQVSVPGGMRAPASAPAQYAPPPPSGYYPPPPPPGYAPH